jgi:hypothetical protein
MHARCLLLLGLTATVSVQVQTWQPVLASCHLSPSVPFAYTTMASYGLRDELWVSCFGYKQSLFVTECMMRARIGALAAYILTESFSLFLASLVSAWVLPRRRQLLKARQTKSAESRAILIEEHYCTTSVLVSKLIQSVGAAACVDGRHSLKPTSTFQMDERECCAAAL